MQIHRKRKKDITEDTEISFDDYYGSWKDPE